RYGIELKRNFDRRHLRQGSHTFGDVYGQIAHALEVVIDFDRRDHLPDLDILQVAAVEQPHRVLINHDLHLIDARFSEKNLAGELGRGRITAPEQGFERPAYVALHHPRNGDQVIHQRILVDDFYPPHRCHHAHPPRTARTKKRRLGRGSIVSSPSTKRSTRRIPAPMATPTSEFASPMEPECPVEVTYR